MLEAIILVFFSSLFFWLWMIVDCVYHESSSKSVWLAIICLMNVAGAFAYLVLRYRANRQNILMPEAMNDTKRV